MKRNERRNEKAQTRGDTDIECAMGEVLAFMLWLSISFCLFTLMIKWTGKNAIEVIKDYIRSCGPKVHIGV